MDLFFRLLMEILEFVHCREFLHIQSIRQHAVGFSLQQMFALVRGNVRYGGEDVRCMRGGPLDAVSMVDSTPSCLGIHVEVLQVVVKVHRSRAEISSEQRCVCGEDGGDIDPPLFRQRKRYAGKPFVEVGNNRLLSLVGDKLCGVSAASILPSPEPCTSPRNHATRYPNTTASFVSTSPGGDGIPAVFHRSAFHSSSQR